MFLIPHSFLYLISPLRSLARLEEERRATKRPAPGDRDDYAYVNRKRAGLSVPDVPMRYDPPPPPRYDSDSKSYGPSSSSDYRGSKGLAPSGGSYDSRGGSGRFERGPPAPNPPPVVHSSASGSLTRRVVQEVSLRRDARLPPSPPPPPPRDRIDDRRVIDRRDDRYFFFYAAYSLGSSPIFSRVVKCCCTQYCFVYMEAELFYS